MSISRLYSAVISGAKSQIIEVEVRVSNQTEKDIFQIIGLADSAIKEAKERVLAALQNSGFKVPSKVLVNLAPADLKKEGASLDLPIALGILAASGQIKNKLLEERLFIGELSLDSRIKKIPAIIAHCLEALKLNIYEIAIPLENLEEVSSIKELDYIPAGNLLELVSYLEGAKNIPDFKFESKKNNIKFKHLSEVKGQEDAKRGLLIAAAGGHNVLLIGAPGCGKSMLAERFQSILPSLEKHELFATLRLHSIASLPIASIQEGVRPFRAPHHSISQAGLIGGGSSPKPGEVSLAHNGVLFLDEFPEFKRQAIESLRAPLENRNVTISRAKESLTFPASFQLIAAMNPCPCGRLGLKNKLCICSPGAIHNYLKKISQPILDRIDIHIDLKPVKVEDIYSKNNVIESDLELQQRVVEARNCAIKRQGKPNFALENKELIKLIPNTSKAIKLLDSYAQKTQMSLRSYFRISKIALSIADLEKSLEVKDVHMAEALTFRGLEVVEEYLAMSN